MITPININQQTPTFQARVRVKRDTKLIKHPKLTASVVTWCAGISTACLMNRFMSGIFKIF